jgi:G3E family GTPase
MTVIDPLVFVNEFLREKHPEWLDYPAELRRDLRTEGRKQGFTTFDREEDFSPKSLAHWLHFMEQAYQNLRVKSVFSFGNGCIMVTFSAEPLLD